MKLSHAVAILLKPMNKLDIDYSLLKILEKNPKITQRVLAKKLGLSLGKTNYILRALIDKGLLKLTNFRKSDNKKGYIYLLTLKGTNEKKILAKKFLLKKSEEFNKLKKEIEKLEYEGKMEEIDDS